MYWSAVDDLFVCGVVDVEAISGQRSTSQAVTGTLALGAGNDGLNFQVVVRAANVHVVLL